jgi:hypothetical protein
MWYFFLDIVIHDCYLLNIKQLMLYSILPLAKGGSLLLGAALFIP